MLRKDGRVRAARSRPTKRKTTPDKSDAGRGQLGAVRAKGTIEDVTLPGIKVVSGKILEVPSRGLSLRLTPAGQGDELKSLRKRLGLTQEKMADMLGCSTRSLSDYEKLGELPPWLRARIREINTLVAEVEAILSPSELRGWMAAELPAMGGRTPARVIADGDAIQLFLLVRDAAMGGHA